MKYLTSIILAAFLFVSACQAQDGKPSKKSKKDNPPDYTEMIAKMEEQHRKDSETIQKLNKRLGDAKSIDADLSYLLLGSANRLRNTSFSQIDSTELKKINAMFKKYDYLDGNVKKAAADMSALYTDYNLYNTCFATVNSKYDEQKVEPLVPQLKSLKERVKTSEIDTLYEQLSSYRYGVKAFKEIINAIEGDAAIKNTANPKGRFPLVEVVLKDMEDNFGAVSAVRATPWLNVQYNKYLADLKTMSSVDSDARNVIVSIPAN